MVGIQKAKKPDELSALHLTNIYHSLFLVSVCASRNRNRWTQLYLLPSTLWHWCL